MGVRYKTVLSFLYSLAFGIYIENSSCVMASELLPVLGHFCTNCFCTFGFSLTQRWVPFAWRFGGLQLCFTLAAIVSYRFDVNRGKTAVEKKEGLLRMKSVLNSVLISVYRKINLHRSGQKASKTF